MQYGRHRTRPRVTLLRAFFGFAVICGVLLLLVAPDKPTASSANEVRATAEVKKLNKKIEIARKAVESAGAAIEAANYGEASKQLSRAQALLDKPKTPETPAKSQE